MNEADSLKAKEQEILAKVREGVVLHVAQLDEIKAELDEIVMFDKGAMESMGKWLLATLVAINGAAALGLMGSFTERLGDLKAPIILFTAGVVSSVLSGLMERDLWSMAVRLQHSLKTIRDSLAQFENVQSRAELLEKADKLKVKFRGNLLRAIVMLRGWAATAFFYVSLGCFIAGVFVAGQRIA